MKNVCELCIGLFLLTSQLHGTVPLKSDIHPEQRKFAYTDGNFIIGALFPVHEQVSYDTEDPFACGILREKNGIQRVEAALFAVDFINTKTNLLPGIKLGINIRDECRSESISVRQIMKVLEKPYPPPPYTNYSSYDDTNTCSCEKPNSSNETTHVPQLLGIVGPSSSSSAIQVANILKLFNMPQVGYSATAVYLRDIKKYPYFSSLVPSDTFQAFLILKLLKHFNWTSVSVAYTDDDYGQSGQDQFKKRAEAFGICAQIVKSIPAFPEINEYHRILEELSNKEKVKVVVCFCTELTVSGLLGAMKDLNFTGKFLLLGSDCWNPKHKIVQGHEEQALGSMIISVHTEKLPQFEEYYLSRTPANNMRNPWFQKFWEEKFNCTVGTGSSLHACTGNEKLVKDNDDFQVSNVVESIFMLAYKLKSLQADVSKGVPGPESLHPFHASQILNYNSISPLFDEPKGTFGYLEIFNNMKYDIFNYQKLENGKFQFVRIGEFDFKEDYLKNSTVDENFGILRFNNNITLQFLKGDKEVTVSSYATSCGSEIKQVKK